MDLATSIDDDVMQSMRSLTMESMGTGAEMRVWMSSVVAFDRSALR